MLLCFIMIVCHSCRRMLHFPCAILVFPWWQWVPGIFTCVCYESCSSSCHYIVMSHLPCCDNVEPLSLNFLWVLAVLCTGMRYEIGMLHSPFHTKIMEMFDDVLVWISLFCKFCFKFFECFLKMFVLPPAEML